MYQQLIKNYQPDNEQEAKEQEMMLDYFAHSPHDPLTRQSVLAHVTSSGFILNETMDQVLMCHHNIYNTWAWTGGHADGTADLLEVALKEAKEETGVTDIWPLSHEPMSLDILPVWRHQKRGEAIGTHLHFNVSFLLMADSSQPLTSKPDENSAVAWLPIDRLSDYCREPYIEKIYEKLLKKAQKLTV